MNTTRYLGSGICNFKDSIIEIRFGGFSCVTLLWSIALGVLSFSPWLVGYTLNVRFKGAIIALCAAVSLMFISIALCFVYTIIFNRVLIIKEGCCELNLMCFGYVFQVCKLKNAKPADIQVYSRKISRTITWWFSKSSIQNEDISYSFDFYSDSSEIKVHQYADRYCSKINQIFRTCVIPSRPIDRA